MLLEEKKYFTQSCTWLKNSVQLLWLDSEQMRIEPNLGVWGLCFVFLFFFLWSKIIHMYTHTHTQIVIHFDIWAIPKDLGFSKTKESRKLACDQSWSHGSWSWLHLGEAAGGACHLMIKPYNWLLIRAVMVMCAVWTPMSCVERLNLTRRD